jgi:hypothetical protein
MNENPRDRDQKRRFLIAIVLCFVYSMSLSTMTHAAFRRTRCKAIRGAEAESIDTKGPKWHTKYAAAYAKAKRERRMLLVNFMADPDSAVQRELDRAVETDRMLQSRLRAMVLVRVPRDYQSEAVNYQGLLIDHAAFEHLGRGPGIAVVDLAHTGTRHYGTVVTALPYASGKYYRWRNSHLTVALELPPGTITQRTMIWAVRIHPESPASTTGQHHRTLANAAAQHSAYQARIGVQGHHRWETRFHEVRAGAQAGEASEVVAESWPHQNLIDSCIDCVASWRHSPGHWRAVRGRHRLFGYDIRRGRNGIWYGTGIFAN